MKTKILTIAMLLAVLGIVSCSHNDLYDENKAAELDAAKQAKLLEDYKANFIKTYGEIVPTQTWDFSTYNVTYFTSSPAKARAKGPAEDGHGGPAGPGGEHHGPGTPGPAAGGPAGGPADGGPAAPGTLQPAGPQSSEPDPAIDCVVKDLDWYQVEDNTLAYMKEVFPESTDNTPHIMEGTFFTMLVPENDFYILPIFMGESGGNFELFLSVKVGEDEETGDDIYEDISVWKKWENLQYQKENKNPWHTLSKDNNEGGKNLLSATAIKSKPIRIDVSKLPVNAPFHFYLLISEQASVYNTLNDKLGTANGYIKEFQFGPEDVDLQSLPGIDPESEDKVELKFFGCEDASTEKTDKDFNDVVFLCYGQPHVPQSNKVKELSAEVSKRYMIEDLGMSDDSDFNDVVVDVIETYAATIQTYNDGTPLNGFENPVWEKVGTRAEIRALGGTLDLELKIGNTTWKKSDYFDPTVMQGTTNPNLKDKPLYIIEEIDGYDSSENNVEVTVFKKEGNTETALKVDFPEEGAVPLMIATDLKQIWSAERVKFPFKRYEGSADKETTGE